MLNFVIGTEADPVDAGDGNQIYGPHCIVYSWTVGIFKQKTIRNNVQFISEDWDVDYGQTINTSMEFI